MFGTEPECDPLSPPPGWPRAMLPRVGVAGTYTSRDSSLFGRRLPGRPQHSSQKLRPRKETGAAPMKRRGCRWRDGKREIICVTLSKTLIISVSASEAKIETKDSPLCSQWWTDSGGDDNEARRKRRDFFLYNNWLGNSPQPDYLTPEKENE